MIAAVPAIIHRQRGGEEGLDRAATVGCVCSKEACLDAAHLAYLRCVGLTDPATWAAFGLGSVTPADEARLLTPTQRRQLRPSGIWLPTRDPRQPEAIVGLVRLTPAQHQHRFVTAPAGLGCTADLAEATRIILCDAPLTTLRLHQAGVRGLALVEDPAVLPPLLDWLATREVVLLSHKQRGLEAMASALGGVPHRAHLIGNQVERLGDEVRRLLALPDPPPPPRIDPTPHLLHRVWQYSQARLRAGEGLDALGERGLAQADLLAAYGAGYLSPDWQAALSKADAAMMAGRRLANALILPAQDASGEVVDLLACRLHHGGGLMGCWDAPRGLVGSRIATACRSVILVDRVHDLGRLWANGHRNVLILRGVEDLRLNAARLHAAGIREARIDTWHDRFGHVSACAAAGIAPSDGPRVSTLDQDAASPDDDLPVVVLEDDDPLGADEPAAIPEAVAASDPPTGNPPAAPPPPLVLVSHDPDRALATFQAGDITYVVELPFDAATTLEVLARRLGQVHRDRFDLASEAQRSRYADAAGRRLEVEAATIAGHLAEILAQVQALVAPRVQPAAPLPADPDTAALLRDPGLLDHLVASLDHAGWVGDDQAKRLGLLTLAGRLLDDPPWLILLGPASATAQPLGLLADCLPPEARLQGGRITEAGLYHQDRDALHHRVLVLDDAARLRPETATALRILQSRGALTFHHAERDPVTGRLRTRAGEANGPVALLACAQDATPLDGLAMSINLDDSAGQTALVLAAQSRRRQGGGDQRAQVVQRLRGVFQALVTQRVVIPYADRIQFPATRLEHRRDHERFLALIEASALLHQFQRTRVDGAVVASEADFQQAVRAAGGVLGRDDEQLPERAHAVLVRMRQEPGRTWTQPDLAQALPNFSRGTIGRALEDLLRCDLVLRHGHGRGRVARGFQLAEVAVSASFSSIRLLPADVQLRRLPATAQPLTGVSGYMSGSSPDRGVAYA